MSVPNSPSENMLIQSSLDSLQAMMQGLVTKLDRIDDDVTSLKNDRLMSASKTPRERNRRSSLFFDTPRVVQEDDFAVDEESSEENSSSALVTTTRIVTEYVIKDEEMLSKLTVRSFRWLLKNYRRYLKVATDKSKALVLFIKHSVLKDIVNHARRNSERDKDWTYNTIYDASDEKIKMLMADYLRPKSVGEYQTLMFANCTTPKENRDKSLKVDTFNEQMHSNFMELIDEVREYDNLFRHGASASELEKIPKLKFGKSKEPGVFRIAMQCFGEHYSGQLTTMVTETKLNGLDFFLNRIIID